MSVPEQCADVVVIGGGVIGLTTALYLQRAGRSVTLVAASLAGEGASAGNAGMIVPSHVIPLSAPGVISQGLRWLTRRDAPFHLKPQLNLAFLRWLWQFRAHCTAAHVERCIPILRDLGLASVEGFDELAAESDDFGLAHTGLLIAYHTPAMEDAMAHEAEKARCAGLEARVLDTAGLRAKQPHLRSNATGAILYEQDARVDPNLLLASLCRRFEEAGGEMRHGVTVSSIESGRVTLLGGELTAEDIVVCAGAWTPRLVPRISIQPARGYSVTIKAPRDSPPIPMILIEDRVTMTLMPGKLRFAGTLSLSGFESKVDQLRIRPILDEARRYQPDLNTDELPVWSGYRPASPDGLPFIGRVADGVWVNAGHGMMGVSLAPASGKLMCALVTGTEPPVSPGPFAPDRL
ncbi:MAG: D-amino-acid dehydrogenase [Rhodothermales bacterium]|jgi:D-amino-acid dehydrogenase